MVTAHETLLTRLHWKKKKKQFKVGADVTLTVIAHHCDVLKSCTWRGFISLRSDESGTESTLKTHLKLQRRKEMESEQAEVVMMSLCLSVSLSSDCLKHQPVSSPKQRTASPKILSTAQEDSLLRNTGTCRLLRPAWSLLKDPGTSTYCVSRFSQKGIKDACERVHRV